MKARRERMDGLVQFLYTPRLFRRILLLLLLLLLFMTEIFFKGQKITVAGFGLETSLWVRVCDWLYHGLDPVVSLCGCCRPYFTVSHEKSRTESFLAAAWWFLYSSTNLHPGLGGTGTVAAEADEQYTSHEHWLSVLYFLRTEIVYHADLLAKAQREMHNSITYNKPDYYNPVRNLSRNPSASSCSPATTFASSLLLL